MRRLVFLLAWTYLLVGIFSLLLIPASLYEWFGIEKDPLSGVYALILGLPWTRLLFLFEEVSTWFALVFTAFGILINASLLFFIAGRLRSLR